MAFMSTIITLIIRIMTIIIMTIMMMIIIMTIIIMISVVGSFPKAAHWGWKLEGRTLLTTNGDQ